MSWMESKIGTYYEKVLKEAIKKEIELRLGRTISTHTELKQAYRDYINIVNKGDVVDAEGTPFRATDKGFGCYICLKEVKFPEIVELESDEYIDRFCFHPRCVADKCLETLIGEDLPEIKESQLVMNYIIPSPDSYN